MKNSRCFYIALIFCLLNITTGVFAGQKYNPFSGHWETVSPDAQLNYNPYSREYEYAPKGSSPSYNPYERSWDLAPDDYQQRYNPYENSWETTIPDSEPQYNPYERVWEYPRLIISLASQWGEILIILQPFDLSTEINKIYL